MGAEGGEEEQQSRRASEQAEAGRALAGKGHGRTACLAGSREGYWKVISGPRARTGYLIDSWLRGLESERGGGRAQDGRSH